MPKLTYKEWNKITPPIYWLQTNLLKDKQVVFYEIVEKWLNNNILNWWYRDGDVFVFANKEDRFTFKFWILSGVFEEEYGEISDN